MFVESVERALRAQPEDTAGWIAVPLKDYQLAFLQGRVEGMKGYARTLFNKTVTMTPESAVASLIDFYLRRVKRGAP